jgi:uncharacterized protein (TIGR02118 family)
MAQLLVLYATPPDTAAFDKHYSETHIPLVKKISGLRKFELSSGPVVTPFGPSAFHLIATLHFDSMAALQSAMASPEGRTAGEDAQPLMAPGSHLLLFDNREV